MTIFILFSIKILYLSQISSPEKVGELTKQMFGYNLVTKQTSEEGVPVRKVLNYGYGHRWIKDYSRRGAAKAAGGGCTSQKWDKMAKTRDRVI